MITRGRAWVDSALGVVATASTYRRVALTHLARASSRWAGSTTLRRLQVKSLTRLYRWLRLRLPQPWSRRVGQLAYLPKLLRGHRDTRREFAEEAVIEALVAG